MYHYVTKLRGDRLKLEIRPVTRADIIEMVGEPYDNAVRGFSVTLGEKVVGVVGVLHTAPLQAFSFMSDEIRNSPKTIVKAARKMRKVLDSYDAPIYAVASEEEKNSSRFLEFVGFGFHNHNNLGRVYLWASQRF